MLGVGNPSVFAGACGLPISAVWLFGSLSGLVDSKAGGNRNRHSRPNRSLCGSGRRVSGSMDLPSVCCQSVGSHRTPASITADKEPIRRSSNYLTVCVVLTG